MIIKFKNKNAFIEDVSINDVLESNNTPFYLYSQKIITDTYKELQNNLCEEIFFAVKANSNQAILRLMKNLGLGADVVSSGELKRSLEAGFDSDKIIFEGVGKSYDDIEFAIKKNIRLINVESIYELSIINKIALELKTVVDIGIRLNPDIDAETLNKISTGKKSDKFGISINDLDNIISNINLYQNISLRGISCHIGSQINKSYIFRKIFSTMKTAAELILSKNIELKYVDLGGGLGVNYKKDENDLDTKEIGLQVKKIFKEQPYKISFEPGRYLTAKAGIIITRILNSKKMEGLIFNY